MDLERVNYPNFCTFRLLELLEEFESVWKARYLEHGLKYSLAALHVLLRQLIPDDDTRTSTES